MNILIVEDHLGIARYMQNILQKIPSVNIIDIESTFDGAYHKAKSEAFDLLLVDVHLKNSMYDGIDLVTSIRKADLYTPILIVTTFASIAVLERAFIAGVNDYITKPFRSRELELRVEQWISCQCVPYKGEYLQYKNITYLPKKNIFLCDKRHLTMGKKSKMLLRLFLQNPETVLSPSFLQEKLWGDNDFSKKRNVRSNIQILRESLGNPYRKWIQNIRSEGYIFAKNST